MGVEPRPARVTSFARSRSSPRATSPLPFFAALLFIALLSLAGCTANQTPPTPSSSAVRLSVSILQYRSDFAIRQLQVEVENRGRVDITVTSAVFRSSFFAGALSSTSAPAAVVAGGTTDFPVVLPVSSCGSAAPEPRATITYRTPDGASQSTTSTPRDQFSALAGIRAGDCSRQAFDRVARLDVAPALRFATRDGRPVALLDVTAMPTGAPGVVRIRGIQSTTLLSQPEGDLRRIGVTLTARSRPFTITIEVIPSRCEQHVVAEDKIGTVFPFHVDAPSFPNATFSVASSPAVKLQFYAFVARYCGW
jgi:hypothetical protein